MFDVYKQFKVDYFEYHTFLTISLLLVSFKWNCNNQKKKLF